jgi:hypothetical protein
MLDPVRRFVHDNPEAGDWGLGELDYMERNAELFEAFLTRSSFPRRSGRMPLTE